MASEMLPVFVLRAGGRGAERACRFRRERVLCLHAEGPRVLAMGWAWPSMFFEGVWSFKRQYPRNKLFEGMEGGREGGWRLKQHPRLFFVCVAIVRAGFYRSGVSLRYILTPFSQRQAPQGGILCVRPRIRVTWHGASGTMSSSEQEQNDIEEKGLFSVPKGHVRACLC